MAPSGTTSRFSPSWQDLNEPDYRIMFRSGILNPGVVEAVVPQNLRAPAGNRLFLVQFHTQALGVYRVPRGRGGKIAGVSNVGRVTIK